MLTADLVRSHLSRRSNNMSVYSGRWLITLINTSMVMALDSILEMSFLLIRRQLALVRSVACSACGARMASATIKALKRIATAARVAYSSTEPLDTTIKGLVIPILKRQRLKNGRRRRR
jgi:hypothetical protein